MDEKQWKLYVHTNMINGKRYVGITSKKKVEHRWNHGEGYKESPRFYSAIKKYGWDSFSHDVIFDGLTEIQAKDAESYFIDLWKTNDLEYGYNLTTGGEGTPGYHPSDETRQKLSEARKKENLSEETLKRRSDGLKGRKFSDEHKSKIGLANSKKVDMFTLDGVYIRTYDSIKCAEVDTGINHSHISQCCNGSRKTTGGYMWKYTQ